jgi:regulator of protease activity HflC (stomatin/prohibitin superfamily)
LTFIIPVIDRLYRVDLRVITLDVTQQRIITRDNVSVEVDAVVFYQVNDPIKSVVAVEHFQKAAFFITQTTLRDVLGQSELDDLLARREVINQRLQMIVDQATEPWDQDHRRRSARRAPAGNDAAGDGTPGGSRARGAPGCCWLRRVPGGERSPMQARKCRAADAATALS